jgi:hypothetical protein
MMLFLTPKANGLRNRRSGFCAAGLQCLSQSTFYLSNPEKSIWRELTDCGRTSSLTARIRAIR